MLRSLDWEVTVADGWLTPELAKAPRKFLPEGPFDLAVFEVQSLSLRSASVVAGHLRLSSSRPFLLATGQMAVTLPEALLAPDGFFDACTTSEPEFTVRDLATAFESGKSRHAIPGLVLPALSGQGTTITPPRALISNPDVLPPPAYDAFPLHAYAKMSAHVPIFGPARWGWLLTSRGCTFGCTFCSPTLRKTHGRKMRYHSIDYVIKQVDHLQYNLGCNALAIEDDLFIHDRDRTIALCAALANRPTKIPFVAQARIDTLDPELINSLQEAGCAALCMGIESGDALIRNKYKRSTLSNAGIEAIVSACHRRKIHTTLYFMIGFPGETRSQMEATLAFARRLKPMMIQVAWYTPYPGSQAWDDWRQAHQDQDITALSHYNAQSSPLESDHLQEVHSFQQEFYRRFYFDPRYLARFLSKRFPYTITQGHELRLAARTVAFLAGRYWDDRARKKPPSSKEMP